MRAQGHILAPFMRQENSGTGAENRLIIQLNLYTILEVGSIVTIYGLQSMSLRNGNATGAVEVQDASVESGTPNTCPGPTYSCAVFFGQSPTWNATNGSTGSAWFDGSQLRMYVISPAISSTEGRTGQISIAIPIQNPSAAQSSPTIEIEVSGQFMSRTFFDKGIGNRQPLVISGFVVRLIYQSTPGSGADNTVTIVVNSNINLPHGEGGFLKVTGFRYPGANPAPYYRDISLTYSFDAALTQAQQEEMRIFGATMRAYPEISSLIFTISENRTMQANTNYTVSFDMQNPLPKQDSPDVYVQIGQESAVEAMDKLDNMRHPLLVAGFDTKSIQQSDASTSASNTLSVTLRSSANLPNGTNIVIQGLVGTQVCILCACAYAFARSCLCACASSLFLSLSLSLSLSVCVCVCVCVCV